MKRYIADKTHTVFLPYEDGMIEWLNEHYPHSKYRIIEV